MSTLDRVAYKPLGMNLEEDGDDNAYDIPRSSNFHHFRYQKACGLPQFRVLLYLLAIVLFLIFIAQFASNERPKPQHLRSISTPATSDSYRLRLDKSTTSFHHEVQPLDIKPGFDSYLTSVLDEKNHETARGQADDLSLPSVATEPSSSSNIDRWWRLGTRNKYVTVTNYVRAKKSFNYDAAVTLTTQATTEFMYHTLELCKRWDGPISVAIFCPGRELTVAISLIKYLRRCLPIPLSACIRDKVTWHLAYNQEHGPEPFSLNYPAKYLDSRNFSLFTNQDLCPKFPGPEPSDSIRQFEEQLRKANNLWPLNYRQQHKLLYPINVLRNTARLAATTKYVLASDIELYPSINLVPSFMEYVRNHEAKKTDIFTLPIFEVKSNVTAPRTKKELVSLFERGDAVFFHKWVCDWCQNFPNRIDWLQTDKFGQENYREESNEIAIFERTQRDKSRNSWEPIFIGTNEDPLYDDRLTWEGRRDKMGQMYEMCLQDYQLFVLGNAFLVHTPGIKHIDKEDNKKRVQFMISNNQIYDETVKKLQQQFANSNALNKC